MNNDKIKKNIYIYIYIYKMKNIKNNKNFLCNNLI